METKKTKHTNPDAGEVIVIHNPKVISQMEEVRQQLEERYAAIIKYMEEKLNESRK